MNDFFNLKKNCFIENCFLLILVQHAIEIRIVMQEILEFLKLLFIGRLEEVAGGQKFGIAFSSLQFFGN